MSRIAHHSGFTLIEIIVSIGIDTLLMFIAVVAWSSISARSRSEDVQTRVISLLREGREKTLARVGASSWGVHFEATQITLFPGTSFVVGLASSTVYAVPGDVRITWWALSGGGADVLFQSFTGETRQDGLVSIQRLNDTSVEKKVRVYSSGYVEGI